MPKGFTAKDERQVLAIKKSCRARGGEKKDCDRIAFATVNKRRRAEGRTLSDLWGTINQPDYTHYVVVQSPTQGTKIETGWSFKEDAKEHLEPFNLPEELRPSAKILTKVGLKRIGLDPDSDDDWTTGTGLNGLEVFGLTEQQQRHISNIGMGTSLAVGIPSWFALSGFRFGGSTAKSIARQTFPLSAISFPAFALLHPSIPVKALGVISAIPLFALAALSGFAGIDEEPMPQMEDFNENPEVMDIE